MAGQKSIYSKPGSSGWINVIEIASDPLFHAYSHLTYSDAEFFNMQAGDVAIAKAAGEGRAPTLEQVRHVVAAMPDRTDVEKRDRALVAFAILTGARDNAIASMRLKHVDLAGGFVRQNPREGVRTKFSKTLTTTFFPVGDDVRAIVADWVRFLLQDRCFDLDAPLFPATKVARGASGGFEAVGLDKVGWSNAGPIRKLFRTAFEAAGMPYYNPHSFRKTLARLGQERCATPEEFKAWSQNLGHDSVLTTFTSYGSLDDRRQAEILRALASPKPASTETAALASEMRRIADRLAPTMR